MFLKKDLIFNYPGALLWFMIFILIIHNKAYSNDLLKFGSPFIQNYTKKDYKAGNKNWSITQDNEGFIYVGNTNGLLQFDGIRWKRYELPSGTIIRSVYAHDDRVYSGSLGEFGYWEKDDNFNMNYTSLTGLLDGYEFGDQEIWWIVQFDDNIIFQSFSNTFLYDGQRIRIILSNKGVIFPPFNINGRLFIQILNDGLCEIIQNRPVLLPGSELFINKRILTMLPLSGSSKVLIGTEDHGFFVYDGKSFSSWNILNNQSIISDRINRGIKISDNLIGIGTLLGGVYILNENGEVLNHIYNEKGLNNNTVLSFFLDKMNNLWVGLDNGISLIKINSPVYYNIDISGDIGSVYTSAIYKDDLYLGTNRGVFYTNIIQRSDNNRDFKIIPGSQGQVWSLKVIDDILFCGHNTSTFILDNYRLRKISNIAGGYEIKQYPYNDNYIVQGSYNGLSVYNKNMENWSFSHILSGFDKLSKILEFERENVLWVAHTHRGLYRLELNDNLKEITEIREFSTNKKSYVNKINKKLVITSDSGFLYYDDIQNTFFALKEINQSLGSFAFNARIIPAVHDYYWIFKEGDCARVKMDENNVIEMDTQVLNDLNEFLIPGYEDVYLIDSTYTIIYLDNGYAVHQSNWENSNSNYHPDIFIRELNFHTSSGETLDKIISLREIPFRYNNIDILISFPDFSRDKKLMYQLSGYDERWINLKKEGEINFQNLSSGEYTFRITPENGSPYSVVSMNFYIKPVWYQSLTAKIIYAVIFILIFGLTILLNRRKIRKLNEKHRQEQKQLLEIEKAENEKRLAQIRNENLRNEIKLRNSRLAKATFSLIHKNNTLISVKEEIMTIKNELGNRFPTRYFNRIIRNVNNDLTSQKDWRMFEQSFSEVHENFLHRLKNEYSDLTPSDIQLCAYLKMNLSSKEIASLLNITTRGVEIRRYRLRKKLHMDHDTNLVEFIMNY